MTEHDMVISVGPAGTGKTYLAVAMAAAALVEKRVKRLVLARPAVEAGEKLGFLPGDLAEKVNPYLRPLYDALYDMLGYEKVGRMLERGMIEVAPLAFMRGRTLNDAFVILDEAQNTTPEQMKMFLTRIGYNSRAVITGDITQTDLPQVDRFRVCARRSTCSPESTGSASSTSTNATSCATRWCRRSSLPTIATRARAEHSREPRGGVCREPGAFPACGPRGSRGWMEELRRRARAGVRLGRRPLRRRSHGASPEP